MAELLFKFSVTGLDIKSKRCYTIYMIEKLKKRLPNSSQEELEAINSVIDAYGIAPSIDNLDGHGFLFKDLKGRTARVCVGAWKKKDVYIADPLAEITIVNLSGVTTGWIESSKLEDLEDRFVVELKSLNPMPETFSFDQKCSHLQEHGGIYEGEFWICLGCNRSLIFNDK